jgi:hypothetical protein
MRKTWIAGLALILLAASPALAGRARTHSLSDWSDDDGGGDNTFSVATLNGTYVLEASGFADDGKTGEVAVLGTLTFDGVSAVAGNLIFTRGDNAQFSCNDTFTTGTYSITSTSAPGLYNMMIPLTGGSNTGAINFGLLVPDTSGDRVRAIETDNGALVGLTICGAPGVTSLVLKGTLRALNTGGD